MADMGMEVEGENLTQLFSNAAQGMFNLIASSHKFTPKEEFEIEITGENWEELLFKWLGELLFYYDAYKIFLVEFQVKEITPYKLRASVRGEKIKNKKVEREIKAVTYHNLEITQKNNSWKVKVLFDL